MRPVIYQLFVRHFSNDTEGGVPWGSKEQNGCGTFAGVNDAALESLARMGVTHIWLTGVLRHATRTLYPGLPADPACVVKGIAGSPYAVTDYFDVDPDLAEAPEQRLEEFRALLARCRRHGMLPIIDFIPNHVSRCYNSRVRPDLCFGSQDNKGVFYDYNNAFYYLEPQHSDWHMQMPEGEFAPEHGCGRVTGNNAATWAPSAYDWYETVKLNYGSDYRHGAPAAEHLPGILAPQQAVPRTWQLVNAVLAYWQEMGVGGFRCDMAHMVPMAFWRWVICNARLRDSSVFFMAEAYNDHMKLCTGDVTEALIHCGFGGVYDSAAYNEARGIYEGHIWANDMDRHNHPEPAMYTHGVRYLENHDEPRLASPQYWGGQGSAVARALMVAHYGSSAGPVLVYNGQEFSEQAEGPGGYGGDNGRTSIFDYTTLPRLQRWANHGRYDGATLTPQEQELRNFMAKLLPLMQHPALSHGSFYGLNWANTQTPGFGRRADDPASGHRMYAYLRHSRSARATVLAVCNLDPQHEAHTTVHIPANAIEWTGKKTKKHVFRNLLQPDSPAIESSTEELEAKGLPLNIPAGQALLLEWI
ncbi:MAG: hypothetical protein E7031_02780 [Akkermansiaceae bacterium]|nr:hypothetical protein [Akkermansiaceae bacterium]